MVASALIFPQGDLRRVQLAPALGPEELGSWRLVCPQQDVPLWDSTNPVDGADPQGFFPIQAVFLQGRPLAPQVLCDSYAAYVNDCLARASIYLFKARTTDDSVIDVVPVVLDWKIKVSNANVSQQLLAGSIHFDKNDYTGTTINRSGLIGHVSGILGNQFEFWARISVDAGPATPMQVQVAFAVDRLGDRIGAFVGSINAANGGTTLPILNPVG